MKSPQSGLGYDPETLEKSQVLILYGSFFSFHMFHMTTEIIRKAK